MKITKCERRPYRDYGEIIILTYCYYLIITASLFLLLFRITAGYDSADIWTQYYVEIKSILPAVEVCFYSKSVDLELQPLLHTKCRAAPLF